MKTSVIPYRVLCYMLMFNSHSLVKQYEYLLQLFEKIQNKKDGIALLFTPLSLLTVVLWLANTENVLINCHTGRLLRAYL